MLGRKSHRKYKLTVSGQHLSPAQPDCAILYLAGTKKKKAAVGKQVCAQDEEEKLSSFFLILFFKRAGSLFAKRKARLDSRVRGGAPDEHLATPHCTGANPTVSFGG